jgi:hypothetical protein
MNASKLRKSMACKWICQGSCNERNGHESFYKMEDGKDDIKQKQMDMPKDPAKEGMEMDHSKMEGMKRTTCKKL